MAPVASSAVSSSSEVASDASLAMWSRRYCPEASKAFRNSLTSRAGSFSVRSCIVIAPVADYPKPRSLVTSKEQTARSAKKEGRCFINSPSKEGQPVVGLTIRSHARGRRVPGQYLDPQMYALRLSARGPLALSQGEV